MPPLPTPPRIAILGAGITGLTAAWHLRRAGLTPVVFEKSAHFGGAIGTVQSGGWLHELGPNSLLESSPAVAAFIDEIGLGERRIYASSAAKQ
ncbi:MAG TPA: FAD-dependent oxidoreductase, partial [Opitutus sp.]|nr:FAD-dependent oxidoreductase [Opitutus sp.]